MSTLPASDMPLFESLLEMNSGYVLNFTNTTFENFIYQETKKDIYDDKYGTNGDSKAKRLREFIRLESDTLVGKLLSSLIDYYSNLSLIQKPQKDINSILVSKCQSITNKLLGKKIQTESDLINYKFNSLPINKLNIDNSLINVIEQRIKEVEICLKYGAALSCIFLCGSTLEGILLSLANQQIKQFNMSTSSPKDKEGKTKSLQYWTLNDLINVSYDIRLIDRDKLKVAESDGQQLLLSLTFISCLIELAAQRKGASGEILTPGAIAPFVIDAPFGVLDNTYKGNMAKSIPDLVEQVVFLLSSSHWQGSVDENIKNKVGAEYNLVLEVKGPQGSKKLSPLIINNREYDTVRYDCEVDRTVIEEIKA